MFALLLALAAHAQDTDAVFMDVGDLEIQLPGPDLPEGILLGFEVLDRDTVEVRAGRIDPYKNFNFTVKMDGGDAAWEVLDLCLEGRCPDAFVEAGGEWWVYGASQSSASSSDMEWKYVPVRRTSL